MDRHGLIREKTEIKYLILYTMSLLERALPQDDIAECAMVDGGFGYFEFCDAFAELGRDGNVLSTRSIPPLYFLSEDGRRAAQIFSPALPKPILRQAQLAAAKMGARIQRDMIIHASHETTENGTVRVDLKYVDGEDVVFGFQLMVANAAQAAVYEEQFRRHAEKIYDGVLCVLTNDYTRVETDEEEE